MFLASDALLGSTLDSKGLGGLLRKQQTADEGVPPKSLWMI